LNVPPLDAGALQALAEKYALLLHARRCRDAGGSISRRELAAIASRFPGALRELDRNSETALRERLMAVESAQIGAAVPEWLNWVWTYHHRLAMALSSPETLGPGGKLSHRVLKAVAEHHGCSPERVAETLFPRRR